MRHVILGCFLSIGLFAPSALADQCAWISPAEGKKAEELLAQQSELLLYCELCDGDKPQVVRVESLRVTSIENGKYREVVVNGEPVDLAYAFVPDLEKPGYYKNISKLIGCESSGVSTSLKYPADGEKARDDISGRYKKDNVTWEITSSSGVSHSVVVEFYSKSYGANRGRLESMADAEDGKLVVPMAHEGCKFVLQVKGKTVKVAPTKTCGPFGLSLGGEFTK